MAFPFDTIIDLWRDVHNMFGGTGAIRVVGTGTGGTAPILIQNTLVKVPYDYISGTYPSSTQEVYAFKTGGSSGTTVATVTVNYTSSSKTDLSDVTVI